MWGMTKPSSPSIFALIFFIFHCFCNFYHFFYSFAYPLIYLPIYLSFFLPSIKRDVVRSIDWGYIRNRVFVLCLLDASLWNRSRNGYKGTLEDLLGGNLWWTDIPSWVGEGVRIPPSRFMLCETRWAQTACASWRAWATRFLFFLSFLWWIWKLYGFWSLHLPFVW